VVDGAGAATAAGAAGPHAGAVLGLLEASGAMRRGHFRLSSGLHSPAYVQCALLLEQPARARRVGEWLSELLAPLAPESVLSPALGGLIVGHEVAAALDVPFRFTERDAGGAMTLRRGFALRGGERVVVVEDVVTTGKSLLEAAAVARELGAHPIAAAAILDRSGGRFDPGVPFVSLAALDLPTWSVVECPLCAAGGVAEKPGSRPGPAV
jgi:orotate phosphoribosyltransferase